MSKYINIIKHKGAKTQRKTLQARAHELEYSFTAFPVFILSKVLNFGKDNWKNLRPADTR